MKKNRTKTLISAAALLLAAAALPSVSAKAAAAEVQTDQLIALSAEAAPFEVTVTDEMFPSGEIILGSAHSVSGIITSESVMTRVFGGIYTAAGEQVIFYETQPNARSCNISATFEPVMAFGKLNVGEYLYKIEATNEEGQTVTAIESPFTVTDSSTIPSEIAVTGESTPADILPTNAVFSVRGQISSSYPITKIWGGVYNADGTATEVYYEDTPDAKAYDLNATFDNYLDFGLLGEGGYVYRIEATDIRGNSFTVIEKEFEIAGEESAPSDIQLYNPSYPTGTLMQGRGVGIRGSVFSTYAIESVTGGIYKAEGSACDYNNDFVFTVEGGRRSFNLSLIDNDIVFDALPVGEYVYRVTVTDVKGYTKEVISSPFRIRSIDPSADAVQPIMRGMDISAHNGAVDWQKAYSDGMDFVILRAGMTNNSDANYYEDEYFQENYAGARAAGLKIGAYLYTSATNKSEMKADVEGLLKTLDGKQLDMPVYIDVETNRQTALGKAALTELLSYGCQLVTESGYSAGVYSSYNWFRDYIDADALQEAGCEIWLAFYPNDPDTVNFADFCVTWQYCSDGAVNGVAGDVDGDYRYTPLSEESYPVTLVQPEQGTLLVDKENATYGERVTISAELDRVHKVRSIKFNGQEASDNGNGTFSFSMPEEAVEITAELEECDPSETAADFGTITDMPVPFGTASTGSAYFALPCNERLSSLPEALMKLAENGYNWEYSYASNKPAWPLTLMDFSNIYSFIHDHDLDPAVVREVLSDASQMVHRKAFTDEEIDILLGDDEELAMATFASDSTIVIGNKGYSAKWMYYHSTDDYAAQGITPEMVKAVLPYYYNALYVQEAADAFSQNLFSYTSVLSPTKWKQWNSGDVNGNGAVSTEDTDLLSSYLSYEKRLNFTQWAAADMNGDSTVDENDLALLNEKLTSGADPAPSVSLDVNEFCQYPDYPTGCESVSLYMLLEYYDADVTVEQIYDLLPMGTQPYDDENGVRHGANPEREFVGDPRSSYSYGVFNEPIAIVAEQFKPGVKSEQGVSIDRIKEILDTGHPVLAWYVSAPMRDIMYRWTWLDERGELVSWPGGEHAIVVCGYGEDYLTYRDPNAGTTVMIDFDTFSRSFEEMGGRIVYYTDQSAEAPAAESISYTDQDGATQTVQAYALSADDHVLAHEWVYASGDVTINDALLLAQDVNLILTDGSTLTIQGENGTVRGSYALNIFAQAEGSGSAVFEGTLHTNGFTQYGGNVQISTAEEIALDSAGDISILGGVFSAEQALHAANTITLDYSSERDSIRAGAYDAETVTVAHDHAFYLPDAPKMLVTDVTCIHEEAIGLPYTGQAQQITKEDLVGKLFYTQPVVSAQTMSAELLSLMQGQLLLPELNQNAGKVALTADDFELGEVQTGADAADQYTCEIIGQGSYAGTATVNWSIFSDEEKQIASDETLCTWAENDYAAKTGTHTSAEITGKTGTELTIALKTEDGTVADTYSIDTRTGTGSDQAQKPVNLPQTGNNMPLPWLMTVGAGLMTLLGAAAMKASGLLRRRNQ